MACPLRRPPETSKARELLGCCFAKSTAPSPLSTSIPSPFLVIPNPSADMGCPPPVFTVGCLVVISMADTASPNHLAKRLDCDDNKVRFEARAFSAHAG